MEKTGVSSLNKRGKGIFASFNILGALIIIGLIIALIYCTNTGVQNIDAFGGFFPDLALMNTRSENIAFRIAANGGEPYVIALVSFALGMYQFSFLFNKKKCYSLLSIPIKRRKLFLNYFILPCIGAFIAIILVKFYSFVTLMGIHVFSGELLWAYMYNVLSCIQLCFTSYSLGVFGCVLCDKPLNSMLISGAILMVPYFTIKTVAYIAKGIIDNSTDVITDFVSTCLFAICPVTYDTGITHYVSDSFKNCSDYRPLTTVIFWFVATGIGVRLLSIYFENKYKPENCGIRLLSNKALSFICFSSGMAFLFVASLMSFNLLSNADMVVSSVNAVKAVVFCVLSCYAVAIITWGAVSFEKKKLKYAVIGGTLSSVVVFITSLVSFIVKSVVY